MSAESLRLKIHIDGGARGNPGPAAAGVVITDSSDGQAVYEGGIFLGHATNNVAEYHGLLAGLERAAALKASEVEVFSDSELLVRQMNGQYRVKNPALQKLHARAQELARQFQRCTYRHVRREFNVRADELVNEALNLQRNVEGAAE